MKKITKKVVIMLLAISLMIPMFEVPMTQKANAQSIPSHIEKYNVHGFEFNLQLWLDKGVVVYGNYSSVAVNDFKAATQPAGTTTVIENQGYYTKNGKRGEYRFHGYDYYGARYDNMEFPDDVLVANDNLSARQWVIDPWDHGLTQRFSEVNNSEFYRQQLNNNLPFRLRSGVELPNTLITDDADLKIENFIYTFHEPNLRTVGSGTLWHKSRNSGRIFYQTFHIPSLNHRYNTPIDVSVTVLDGQPIDRNNFRGQDVIPVRVKIEAELLDQDYINDTVKRFEHYTRYDLSHWNISVHGQTLRVEPTNNKGITETIVNVPVSSISNNRYTITANATAHYIRNQSPSKAGSAIANFSEISLPTPPQEPTPTPIQPPPDTRIVAMFDLNRNIEFVTKDQFTASNIGYRDRSLGNSIIRHEFTLKRNGGGSWSFAVNSKSVNDNTIQQWIYSIISSHFPDVIEGGPEEVERLLEAYQLEQRAFSSSGDSSVHWQYFSVSQLPEIEEMVYVIPDLRVPEYGFDIVGFGVNDHTDMSTVDSVSYYIDGQVVSPNQLLNNNYIFGIGRHGIRLITAEYVSTTGMESRQSAWTMIYDTKPRGQVKIEGSFKENRKMALQNTSNDANNSLVIGYYPISSIDWNIQTLEGSSLRYNLDSASRKEFLANGVGTHRVEVTVTNTLGRTSDPYVMYFPIIEDVPPAVILHPYINEIARGEELRLMYDAVSVDGDSISHDEIRVYHDSNHDGNYDKLIETLYPNGELASYTPPEQLGRYKLVAEAVEIFGEDTFTHLLDGSSERRTIVETVFEVDNYQPAADVYMDIPITRPNIDVFFLLDRNLNSQKRNYILNNVVTINNQFRDKNINPVIGTWDLHTYTYSTSASTSRYTGTSYPPASISYSSGGYSGTLYRYSVTNNSYWEDQGRWRTRTVTKGEWRTSSQSFSDSHDNTVTSWGRTNPWVTDGTNHSSPAPSSKYVSSNGYTGYIPRTGTSTVSPVQYTYYAISEPGRQGWYSSATYRAHYSGTLSKTYWYEWNETETYWDENWVLVDDYTGFYSGTIYRYVKQTYNNSFFRVNSDKYIVYVSDTNVNDLADLQTANNNNESGLLLVGQSSMQSQINHEKYIPMESNIENVINNIIDYIAESNPAVPSYYALLGETFDFQFAYFDDEGDGIAKDEMQIIHDYQHYDNSTGLATNATPSYTEVSWINRFNTYTFTKPGKYTFFRRVMDKASNDPNFSDYNYYSGISEVQVFGHRKPIADVRLDWDYNTSKGLYDVLWDDLSYDLDHQYSREDRGIADRKMQIRRSGQSHWIYGFPNELIPGTYEGKYVVQDIEGIWSDEHAFSFVLPSTPQMQLEAQAKTELDRYSLSSVPASEKLILHDVWTRYPYSHYLTVGLYQGGSLRTTLQQVSYSTSTATKVGNDYYWNDIVFNIPTTLADGNYEFRITAIGQGGVQGSKSFNVTVNTPINLEIVDFPTSMVSGRGEIYDLKANTSKYANQVQVTLQRNTTHQTTVTLNKSTSGFNASWLNTYTVPTLPDNTYQIMYRATTPNGNVQTLFRNYQVTANQPPTITNIAIQPTFIYEGDNVTVSFRANDPDDWDKLNVQLFRRVKGTTNWGTAVRTWTNQNPGTNLSHTFYSQSVGGYELRIVVTDTFGESFDTENHVRPEYMVHPLGITSAFIRHTDLWNQNRISYNQHHTGTNDEPRAYSVFWAGEKLILEVNTTVINMSSLVAVTGVTASATFTTANGPQIVFFNMNSVTGSNNQQWQATIEDDWLERIQDGANTFTFVATWNNGTTKQVTRSMSILGVWTDYFELMRRR